jgi:hypothetical protein
MQACTKSHALEFLLQRDDASRDRLGKIGAAGLSRIVDGDSPLRGRSFARVATAGVPSIAVPFGADKFSGRSSWHVQAWREYT